ncbi:MAG: 16S rRNA (guanine(966)-N(2))-methyltransferase RsmD [Proteiniphilum sp.]|nr:16S rRNA (guanine(966)-N(2))-methyltransferase RsmD [Proteiniphilum sp.]
MRIISGKYKSRIIKVPANFKARPTTDFARENLFNILTNIIDWEDTIALDLFSGTGSIAFELVSRGCPRVVSVEANQMHYKFICNTMDTLKANELWPLKADVFKYLKNNHEKFDFIFADPPYDLPQLNTIPDIIFSKELLKPEGLFILEHSSNNDFSEHPHFWKLKKYGSVNFSMFQKEA